MHLGWTCHIGKQEDLPSNARIFVEEHSRINLGKLPSFVGSHIIRDPRDVVVSGYFYHLKCKEEWCLESRDEFGGRSYQDVLGDLDMNEGIEFEMRNIGKSTLNEMLSWDYEQANVFEMKYEQLVDDETGTFAALFKHYGLTTEQIGIGLQFVEKYSFKNVRRSRKSEIHLRSGKANQWRTIFTDSHVEICKSLYGEGLVTLGYENDLNW